MRGASRRSGRLPALSAAITTVTASTATAAAAATTTVAATATAAATTTVTATATAAATTAVGGAFFTGAGFVHGQGAAHPAFAVEFFDGGFHAFTGAHGDEAETAGAAAFTVSDDGHFGDVTVLAEEFADVEFGRVEGKIPDVHFGVDHRMLRPDALV